MSITGKFYHIDNNNKDDMYKFLKWLDNVPDENLPITLYICGITYTLKNELWRDLFIVGFRAALDTVEEIDDKRRI